MKWLTYIIIAIVVFCSGYGIGSYNKEKIDSDTIFSTSRTIDIKRDTILSVNPLPILAYFSSKDSIKVGDTILPKEVKEYKDSNYYAVVSGIEPQLDSIKVYPETKIIHDVDTKIITKSVKQRKWSIGLQCGYGVTKSGLSPYLGIGINYNIKL